MIKLDFFYCNKIRFGYINCTIGLLSLHEKLTHLFVNKKTSSICKIESPYFKIQHLDPKFYYLTVLAPRVWKFQFWPSMFVNINYSLVFNLIYLWLFVLII
jgi:hypothetical protein